MPEVRVGKDESLDRALRRFKQQCRRSGVLRDARKHEVYEKPSVRRKKSLRLLAEEQAELEDLVKI